MARKKIQKGKKKEEEIELRYLGKSVLVEEDLRRMEGRIEVEALEKRGIAPGFYKRFVLRCGKCVKEFEHSARIPAIVRRVRCPECKHMHVIKIRPISGRYEIEFSKGIKEVRHK